MAIRSSANVGLLLLALAGVLLSACAYRTPEQEKTTATSPLFNLLAPDQTGIDFRNTLTEGLNTNVLMYEYFYNGGGVCVGDVNGDGFQDIYFSGNMVANKLYLNKGNHKCGPKGAEAIQFEDVTDLAGVAGRNGPWKTGVSMADVNGDGLLDIYLCYSGNLSEEKRKNQLYINLGTDEKGVPHFVDQAGQYGLANAGFSTQAVFFDYDRDRDLDMLLLNHNPKRLSNLNETSIEQILKKPAPMIGVRLFRHDKISGAASFFKDVTEASGFSSSALNYSLGAAISDINNDGWPDIYISNDYLTPDYLYINNGDGRFYDELRTRVGHTSEFSMGNDIADINNDGLQDIFTLDMLPEDNHRQKLLFSPDNYAKFDLNVRVGFHHQYMRNMLHVNNGDGSFSETGQFSGVSNTDWSWAPLFADFDNDGWKDLFVTNGYLRDYTNMDFLKYMSDFLQKKGKVWRKDLLELMHKMPSSNVVNYIYKNIGHLAFADMRNAWGINIPSNSNGAAYSDLDNDGDLDLIVNNINQPAFVYENRADKLPGHHYLQVKLQGEGMNTQGFGAKVTIYAKGKGQTLEQMPVRGYQSGVSPVLHFGLGNEALVDSIRVVWLNGRQQDIFGIDANQIITIEEKKATETKVKPEPARAIATEVTSPISFQHKKNAVNDFNRQRLLVNPLSFSGPCLAKGDVNGDGLEDVYVGGGSGQSGQLYVQQRNGNFLSKRQRFFEIDKESEDVDAVFFDANGDGFSDLYVCSGGFHSYAPDDPLLQDRLYLNDGKGSFRKSKDALPVMLTSSSCVRVTDFNDDGSIDLFVGGRVVPGRYPETPQSYLLLNDGQGHFKDIISDVASSLQKAGMVTDAAWADVNRDREDDLIVTGEWMPLTIYIKSNGRLIDRTTDYFDKHYTGWWNKITLDDFNEDGRPDIVVGNMGLNTQCKASDTEPADLWYKDFDSNGYVDPILCFYIQGKSYPFVTRDELLDQISIMRGRFPDYKSYAHATLTDIFTAEELQDVNHLKVSHLTTAYFQSDADGRFHEKALPIEAQFSPVFTITPFDYDKDGHRDILLCGNINEARLRFGKSDANFGLLLKGDGKGNFRYIPQEFSGFQLKGDVRSVIEVNDVLLFGINQEAIKAYKITGGADF